MPGSYIKTSSNQHGISLIELVIFIVIVSVALTGITLIYLNATRYSADPMIRIRSIELAQSTLEEILLKGYDHSTPVGGGCVEFPTGSSRCPAGANPVATSQTIVDFGNEGETRATFNDVDDYHNLAYCGIGGTADAACAAACTPLLDESGNNIAADYAGFAVCIRLSFAGGAGAEINTVPAAAWTTTVLTNDAKRIDVIVTDPLGSRINLSAYRLNF